MERHINRAEHKFWRCDEIDFGIPPLTVGLLEGEK